MARTKINPKQIRMLPLVSAYRHNGAGTPVAGPAVFIMTVALLNVDNCYGVNTTGVFTAPYAGNYYVNFSGFKENGASSGPIHIRKNGVGVTRTYTSVAAYESVSLQLVIPCAAGDTIDIYIGSGLSMHGNESSQLVIMYLGG